MPDARSSLRPNVGELADGLRNGDRGALSRSITLVESTLPHDRETADELLDCVWPDRMDDSTRFAITGPPGAGKSTLIEAVGGRLLRRGRRVAVLAVDPSSHYGGGSILGDKTRMARLAASDNAYIRPSPAAGSPGGVTRTTREVIALCEVAGFDTIIVETVGVGQAEIDVASMVDFVLLVVLAGAGDELQGIKRGILEVADIVAVNKLDLDRDAVMSTRSLYRAAFGILHPRFPGWSRQVIVCSALTGVGIESVEGAVVDLSAYIAADGMKRALRTSQLRDWFVTTLRDMIVDRIAATSDANDSLERALRDIEAGDRSPGSAARMFVERFLSFDRLG